MWYVIVGVAAAVLTIGQYSIWGYYGTCKSIFVLFMIIALNTKLVSESTAVAAGSGVKMGFFLQNVGTIVLGFAMAFVYSWE